MSTHNPDTHALRQEVDRLNHELKARDQEIAALKTASERKEQDEADTPALTIAQGDRTNDAVPTPAGNVPDTVLNTGHDPKRDNHSDKKKEDKPARGRLARSTVDNRPAESSAGFFCANAAQTRGKETVVCRIKATALLS